MASSQVEIASSSPFVYVLRDRNQHNGCRTRDSNAFQKNFNDLVQNQLSSCRNAGSNENSNPGIDFADLWVHHPQATTDDNNHHARETGHTRISEHSNSNENSHQNIDYTDLWVHNPQGNNDENSQKKSNFGGKCDSARNTVLAVERKSEIGVSSRPLACPPRGRSQDGAQSQPASRVRSPEPLKPVLSSRRRRSLGGASLGPASTSQKGKSQNGISSPPVLNSQTDSSAEVPNLGAVSSLVQKWRNFEGKKSSAGCSSKCNSGMALADNASFVEAPGRGSDACDESVDIRPDTPTISEESNADWESVRTGFSASPGRDSDTTENERIRVADIIRKLTSNGEEQNDRDHTVFHESLPRVRTRTSVDHSEQRHFSPVSCSPRIRGRQAFSDFQMQMERERHKELEGLAGNKAVSKFSHRGRIQAMLKIRFLHRGAEVKDYQRLNNCLASNSKGLKQSAIVHLRERFSLRPEHCASHLRSPQVKMVDCNTEIEKSSVSRQQRKDNPTEPIESATSAGESNSVDPDINNHESNTVVEQNTVHVQSFDIKDNHQPEPPQQENTSARVSKGCSDRASSFRLMPVEGHINLLESDSMVQNSTLLLQNSEIFYQDATSGSDDIQQCSSSDSCVHRKPEFPVTGTSFQCTEGNVHTEFQEANNQQLAGNGNGLTNEISDAQGDWEEEKHNNHPLDCNWVSDVFHRLSGLEELQSDYHQQEEEINHDWINDVSRPRSTWEDLRQARYQEMLDPFMENDEIRRLLQRKSVSSFLSSGMRERIDRLMVSRTQQISRPDQLDGESEQMRVNKEEEEHGGGEEEEYEQSNEEEEEEAEDSIVCNDDYEFQEHDIHIERHNAAKSYINQTTSWVHRDHEVSDNYSDQAASSDRQQSPLTNASTLESQWSMNHHSVEMELIYQMKGNMEQIHQEISELRRSIKSCVNMQMELKQSIKQEIAAALCQPGKQKRRERSGDSSRGRCCICYEVPIDSLLYRCGHMCTCFACAHELQWGSGKCPVCRAPILDVVRAYAHS